MAYMQRILPCCIHVSHTHIHAPKHRQLNRPSFVAGQVAIKNTVVPLPLFILFYSQVLDPKYQPPPSAPYNLPQISLDPIYFAIYRWIKSDCEKHFKAEAQDIEKTVPWQQLRRV